MSARMMPEAMEPGEVAIEITGKVDAQGRVQFFAYWHDDVRWRGGGMVAGQVFLCRLGEFTQRYTSRGERVTFLNPEARRQLVYGLELLRRDAVDSFIKTRLAPHQRRVREISGELAALRAAAAPDRQPCHHPLTGRKDRPHKRTGKRMNGTTAPASDVKAGDKIEHDLMPASSWTYRTPGPARRTAQGSRCTTPTRSPTRPGTRTGSARTTCTRPDRLCVGCGAHRARPWNGQTRQ